jgi:hypothetical protein
LLSVIILGSDDGVSLLATRAPYTTVHHKKKTEKIKYEDSEEIVPVTVCHSHAVTGERRTRSDMLGSLSHLARAPDYVELSVRRRGKLRIDVVKGLHDECSVAFGYDFYPQVKTLGLSTAAKFYRRVRCRLRDTEF